MELEKISNLQKYENYREQFKRLNKAIISGFNLEAVFIEYAIIEDRTESVLHHAGKWEAYLKKLGGRNETLHSKIGYIKKQAESNRKDLLNKYFNNSLLDDILTWKEERNRLIHALLKQQLVHNEIKELAERGKVLTEMLRTKSGNYNRAMERYNKKNVSKDSDSPNRR